MWMYIRQELKHDSVLVAPLPCSVNADELQQVVYKLRCVNVNHLTRVVVFAHCNA